MTEQNKSFKKIIPAAFFQIGKWVILDDKGGVGLGEGDIPLMVCKDLGGDYVFIRFERYKGDEKLDTEEVKKFFISKQLQMVSDKEILKAKDYLEGSEEIEVEIESLNLSRKEEREWLKQRSQKTVKKNWEITTGKWMRGAISSTSEVVVFNNIKYPIYESKTIIYDNDNEPSKSGLYYITKNRHSIPVMIIKGESSSKCFLNKNVTKINEFITLINHGIRTAKKNVDFLPEFIARGGDLAKACKSINGFKRNRNYERYIDGCRYLLRLAEEDPKLMNKVFVELPSTLAENCNFEKMSNDNKSMLNTLKDGYTRIYHWDESEEEKAKAEKSLLAAFKDCTSLYGFYDIVSVGDEVESNTYGFMPNNFNVRKIYYDISTLQEGLNNIN